MKKQITLYLAALIFIFSCGNNEQESQNPYDLSNEIIQEAMELNNRIATCFGTIDTSMNRSAIGCNEGYYGVISKEYVLRIDPVFLTQREDNSIDKLKTNPCKKYNITKGEIGSQLLIFEKDSVHLNNVCSDLVFTNIPKPKRTISAINGSLKVILNPTTNNVFIKIDSLLFIDSLFNNKKIEIKNIVLWDVKNWGTPG